MSKTKVRTVPDLAPMRPEYKEDQFTSWQYNVADRFKDKSRDQIKSTLKTSAFPFAVCGEQWSGDFNFSTLIRNANGFNAKAVYYLGDKRFDRRGCQGVHHYTDVNFIPTIYDLIDLKKEFTFVGVDNVTGSVPMTNYIWPDNALLIFGCESVGLTKTMQSLCRDIVHINMFGSVRSFNCGTASGIAMHDYVTKFAAKNPAYLKDEVLST